MKVKELIEKLKKCDPEAICVYSGDDEGNYFGEIYFDPTDGLYNENEKQFSSFESIAEEKEEDDSYSFEGKKAVCVN